MAHPIRTQLPMTLLLFATRALAEPAAAPDDESLAQEDRIAALERTVQVLADELERTRADITVPENAELVSYYGLGPAASKVYQKDRGLSMGGYGEAYYRKYTDANGASDTADFLRAVLYTGYKFNDWIVFNSEIEFEHATTEGEGSVSVEFAALDFMWKEWANFRAGLVLLPVGFLNEIHEPPFYFGVNRPDVERRIIPTTWRENGAGIFGSIGEGIEFKAFVVNGLDAEGFEPSGIRDGRQNGSEALAEHLAFVGRLDWFPTFESVLGASFYYGKSGQNQRFAVDATDAGTATYDVDLPDAPTTLFDLHAQYKEHGLTLRALFTMAFVGENGQLTRALGPVGSLAAPGGIGALSAGEAIGGEMLGAYGTIAYDVLPLLFPDTQMSLEPFFRFEYLDTQRDLPSGFEIDRSQILEIYTAGFSFEPIPRVVIKMDYRNRRPETNGASDEFNMGVGYVF